LPLDDAGSRDRLSLPFRLWDGLSADTKKHWISQHRDFFFLLDRVAEKVPQFKKLYPG
jgi:hypothetical protein